VSSSATGARCPLWDRTASASTIADAAKPEDAGRDEARRSGRACLSASACSSGKVYTQPWCRAARSASAHAVGKAEDLEPGFASVFAESDPLTARTPKTREAAYTVLLLSFEPRHVKWPTSWDGFTQVLTVLIICIDLKIVSTGGRHGEVLWSM